MGRIRGLQILGIDVENIRNNSTTCPQCSDSRKKKRDRCLSVNVETGHVKCHHCGWTARADSDEWLDKENEIVTPVNSLKTFKKPKEQEQSDLKPYCTKPLTKSGLDYLKSRGISQATAQRLRIAENPRGWLCFNQYNGDRIFNCKYRKIDEKKFYQHGGDRGLYNLDAVKGQKSIVLTEGELDTLSFEECGIGAVSLDLGAPNVGTESSSKLRCLEVNGKHLNRLTKIYLAVDKDENGQYLLEELIRRFGKTRCLVVDYPEHCKDANDVLVKYGKERLIQCYRSAKPVPVNGIIRLEDVWESMVHGYQNGKKRGETTHIKELDQHFTWYPGDSYTFTGNDGNGKSEIAKYLMLVKSALDGWKWAVFSPEHHPATEFYDDLIHTFVGKSTDRRHYNFMTAKEYELAASFIKDHFFFIYPEPDDSGAEQSEMEALHTPNNIREKIKYLVLTEGINGYMVDPWNQLLHLDMDRREDLYLAVELTRFHTLDKNHDLVGIIVNHPKSMGKNADGSFPKPSKYDISGGKMWSNKTNNMVIVHRHNLHIDPKSSVVEFDVQKVKRQKLVGVPGKIEFDFDVYARQYSTLAGDNPLQNAFRQICFGEQQQITFDEKKEEPVENPNIIKPDRNRLNDEEIEF